MEGGRLHLVAICHRGVGGCRRLAAGARPYRGNGRGGGTTFTLAPYHLLPSSFFETNGLCLWWKVRHCIKVSVAAKKVDVELMLSLAFACIFFIAFKRFKIYVF